MLGIALPVWAFDFESQRPEGYTLYFNILEDDEDNVVEVTYPATTGNDRWQGHRTPWGELVIPAEVEHDGVTYTVVAIGDRAFSGCNEITSLNIPSTVTEIGAYAFYQCTGIKDEVTIGEEIVRIGRSAFYGCSGIAVLRFNAIKCEGMGGTRSTIAFGACRSLTRIEFGPGVTRIPDYAFVGMDALNMEWALPPALQYIGEYAFAYCNGIRGSLILPREVTHIGSNAFAQCHNITQIELPLRLQQIDQRAFYQCIGVKDVNVKTIAPPALGVEAFAGIKSNVPYNVPCISIERYKQDPSWKRIRNLKTTYPCKLDVVATVSDSASGIVRGGGTYELGTHVSLLVICNAGYGFRGWNDGNLENPREIVVNDTATYIALMQPAEIIHEVEYVHDTTYMEGKEIVTEYYEINDMAEPIDSQKDIVYNRDKRRIEVSFDPKDIVSISLYNDVGQCVFTGLPKKGRINMRRFPTGSYIVRVSTIYDENIVRFFHVRKR